MKTWQGQNIPQLLEGGDSVFKGLVIFFSDAVPDYVVYWNSFTPPVLKFTNWSIRNFSFHQGSMTIPWYSKLFQYSRPRPVSSKKMRSQFTVEHN